MTVALVLVTAMHSGLSGQLEALGVRKVDVTLCSSPAAGFLAVAATARAAREPVLVCSGDLAASSDALARLLRTGRTAALTTRQRALLVATDDLPVLADTAAALAAHDDGDDTVLALLAEVARRGVRVTVSDVSEDGLVAALLADPLARPLARWAARCGVTAPAVTAVSFGLGMIAAIWFSASAQAPRAVGVAALCAAFLAGRVRAVLAADDSAGFPPADWLAAASAAVTEYAVYASLAVGDPVPRSRVWPLAIAAMTLLAVRQMAGLCFERAAADRGEGSLAGGRSVVSPGHAPPGGYRGVGPPDRRYPPEGAVPGSAVSVQPGGSHWPAAARWIGQFVMLARGERVATICVTAGVSGARLTFLVLLGWGAVAAGYALAARVSGRGGGQQGTLTVPRGAADSDHIAGYRDDGPVSRWLGRLVDGHLPPLLPTIGGLIVTLVLAALGPVNLPGILVFTPVVAMLLAGLGASHPHDGRLDWLVPPLLQTSEYTFLGTLGFGLHVPPPLIFALLAAVAMRHLDVVYRARHGVLFRPGPPRAGAALGWEGRMLAAALAAELGIGTFAYAAIAGYLWLLFCWDFLTCWRVSGKRGS